MKEERNKRLHQQTDIQTQMADLTSRVEASQSTGSMTAGNSRNDEAVIGGFRGKSKAGAILICQKIIAHVAGNPKILEDRVGNALDVIVIELSRMEAARQFVTDQKNAKHFDGFWCNISQTPEERDHFKKNVQPLFKIKRAILEITSMPAGQVVVKKSEKKVFVVMGDNLKEVAEMRSRRDIVWDKEISEDVKTRYAILTE